MEIKLKELLNSINSRFSGPESCRLHDMIVGKLEFDDEEIENYLNRIIDFGGIYGNHNKVNDSRDAKHFLNLLTKYIDNRNKERMQRFG